MKAEPGATAAARPSIALERCACVVCGCAGGEVVAAGTDLIYQTSDQTFRFIACADCGHLYLNPRPAPESAPRIYPPDYGARFDRTAGVSALTMIKDLIMRLRIRPLHETLSRPGMAMLEIGCGNGGLLRFLRRAYPEAVLWGNDLQFNAAWKAEAEDGGITLRLGLAEHLELQDDHFDLIVMNQLFEHLWEPRAVLDKLSKSVRKGGRITLETPNPDSYDRKLFSAGDWGAYYFPRHLNLYSRRDLERMFADYGFFLEKVIHLATPVTWIYSMRSRRERLSPLLKTLILPLARITPVSLAVFTALDLLAKACCCRTSNYQLIFVKR